MFPGDHVKLLAPLALKTIWSPEQIDAKLGVATTVGTGFVFTATVAAPKQVPSETATV